MKLITHYRRSIYSLSLTLLLTGLALGLFYGGPRGKAASNTSSSMVSGDSQRTKERVREDYGKLPLSFVENKGQADARVKFMSGGGGYSLFLTSNEAVMVLTRRNGRPASFSKEVTVPQQNPPERSAIEQRVLRMEMVGAHENPAVFGSEELPGKVNYLIGDDSSQWFTNLPTFAKVRYQEVYPGIDLIYYGNQGRLEYDFVVSPGADPRAIKLKLAGADHLKLNDAGDLLINIAGDKVTLHRPLLYQVADDGGQREIEGRYVIKGNGQVLFDVKKFDTRKPLVIDPVLAYSTEIGSGGNEYAYSIAVDASGSAYITGQSISSAFPTTAGSLKPQSNSGDDAFVTKLNPEGTALVYSTFLGGTSLESGNGIAVDSSGNAYITGYTESGNFPTVNAIRQHEGNLLLSADGGDHWVGKNVRTPDSVIGVMAFDPLTPSTIYAGGSLGNNGIYKSTDGGNSWNALSTGLPNGSCQAIVVDPSTPSTIYAALSTGGFGGTGVYKSTDGGNSWNSVSSGLNSLTIGALAIDPKTPSTLYAGTSFGIYKSTNGGASWSSSSNGINYGGFIAIVVDPVTPTTIYACAGGGGVFKTTNGGANWSQVNAGLTNTTVRVLAIDPTSVSTLYAGTAGGGVFKSTNGGGNWTAINSGLPTNTLVSSLAINPAATSIVYLGTNNGRIFKTSDGGGSWSKIYETLTTTNFNTLLVNPSVTSTILVGANSNSSSSLNDYEAFVSKLNPQGSALIYSTYLGGNDGDDFGQAIAIDAGGSAYVVGRTASPNFILANPFQAALKGRQNVFITKFDPAGALAYSTYLGGSGTDVGYGGRVSKMMLSKI